MSQSNDPPSARRQVREQRVKLPIEGAGRGVAKLAPLGATSPAVDRLIHLVVDRLLLDLKCMSSKDDET